MKVYCDNQLQRLSEYLWVIQRNNVMFTFPYLVQHTLKGIPEQSEIGVLSLFEHYGSCTVSHQIMTIYTQSCT